MAMEEADLTVWQLHEMTGLERATIYSHREGKRMPGELALAVYSEFLNKPIDYFFTERKPKKRGG